MKIFLDTASLKEIKEAATLGVVDGITTNPSLLAKEGGDPEAILLEICRIIDGPISAEVVATEAEGMVGEGRHLASLHPNIVVKTPCIPEGLKAAKTLSSEGTRINMTLIFSATQALGFGMVWIALIIFCVESLLSRRTIPAKPVPELR